MNADEPQLPAVAIGSPPAWLDADGIAEWNRIRPALELGRIVSEVDLQLLAAYCDAVARAIRTSRRARKDRRLDARAERAWDHARKLGALFGLGPAERSRVSAAPAPEQEADAQRARFFLKRA